VLSQFFTTLIFKVDYRRIGNVAPLGKAVSNYSLSHNGMDSQPHLLKILLDEKKKKKKILESSTHSSHGVKLMPCKAAVNLYFCSLKK